MFAKDEPTSSGRVYRVEQIRALDQAIINSGVAGIDLMMKAAQAAYGVIQREMSVIKRVVIFTGSGLNAGDGFLLATLMQESGIEVQVLCCKQPDCLKGDAASAWRLCRDSDISIQMVSEVLPDADLYVDAILGTGLNQAIQPPLKAVVDRINESDVAVVALDIPTGVQADTGQVLGGAIKADITVSFMAYKIGLFMSQGVDCCGKVFLAQLGAETIQFKPADCKLLSKLDVVKARRLQNSHKGLFGHILCIGGDYGMAGAIKLTAEAALRSGAGLVSVWAHPESIPIIMQGRPELMARAYQQQLRFDPFSVLVLGPGLGKPGGNDQAWQSEVAQASILSLKAMVIDADGLNYIQGYCFKDRKVVLTPHPGEAARLLACTTDAVQADRIRAAGLLSEIYQCVVVLKGAGSVIMNLDGRYAICPYGNPGMSGPGFGDVLSGILASFLAQYDDPFEAAQQAVLVHALAGDAVSDQWSAASKGAKGMLAGDLIDYIPRIINP